MTTTWTDHGIGVCQGHECGQERRLFAGDDAPSLLLCSHCTIARQSRTLFASSMDEAKHDGLRLQRSRAARSRRLDRIRLGLCVVCGENRPAPGSKSCADCRDHINHRRGYLGSYARRQP